MGALGGETEYKRNVFSSYPANLQRQLLLDSAARITEFPRLRRSPQLFWAVNNLEECRMQTKAAGLF